MTTIYDKFSLKGKTSIVTGGGGLLGKEFVNTCRSRVHSIPGGRQP